jgi:hypothetical protein
VATVINKGGTDKTVIMAIRELLAQPFQAPEWLDLRVGFLLSLTKAAADDDPTGLAEEITGNLGASDRFQVGLTDRQTGTIFIGYTNRGQGSRPITTGTSKLVSSDIGIGTTNAWFWRPKNSISDHWSFQMVDADGVQRAISTDGSQIHFPQDVANAGGYAVLLSMRLTRDNTTTRAKIITVTIKKATAGGHSGDVLFTNLPTAALLQTNLQSFPATVQQFGPVEMSQVPDVMFVYWPFRNSRIRIHAMGVVKAS